MASPQERMMAAGAWMETITTVLQDALKMAEEDAAESNGDDINSYGAGYDTGYRDALRRALCVVLGLDEE